MIKQLDALAEERVAKTYSLTDSRSNDFLSVFLSITGILKGVLYFRKSTFS